MEKYALHHFLHYHHCLAGHHHQHCEVTLERLSAWTCSLQKFT
jgi:hypothetical protein